MKEWEELRNSIKSCSEEEKECSFKYVKNSSIFCSLFGEECKYGGIVYYEKYVVYGFFCLQYLFPIRILEKISEIKRLDSK